MTPKWILLLAIIFFLAGCVKIEPAATTVAPAPADWTLEDENFYATLNELVAHLDEVQGSTVEIVGFVHAYGEEETAHLPIRFAVLRDYVCCEEDSGYIGLDCYYEGELPLDGDWVRASGSIARYEDEAGDIYPLLMVQSLRKLSDGEHGNAVVTT